MIRLSTFVGLSAGATSSPKPLSSPQWFLFLVLLSSLLALNPTEAAQEGAWVEVVASGYSPTDPGDAAYDATKGKWRWICADGHTDVRTAPFGVAIPRHQWPYGTKIQIPVETGYLPAETNRIYTADDTGSHITRETKSTGIIHIDLRFKTPKDAIQFGVRTIRIFVFTGE